MGENSKIEWTDHTFNPWIGCTKVSPGCKNCYAEVDTFARRERAHGRELWGPNAERHKTSVDNWRKPYRWNDAHVSGERHQRVFCASLADVFEDHPQLEDWRYRLFDVIETTSNLDWLLLTKRPQNILRMVPQRWLAVGVFPKNIWIGTSIENQKTADERIPHLVQVPAVVRFLSCEPLLEKVDLELRGRNYGVGDEYVNWVICGGESGRNARPMHPDWARSIRDQCVSDDVPFFFKQWGGLNKKQNGRILDGVEWSQFPVLEAV